MPNDETNADRKYVAKLPRGTKVNVDNLISRLAPAGKYYYFVCESDAVPFKFDVPVNPYWKTDDDFLYLGFARR